MAKIVKKPITRKVLVCQIEPIVIVEQLIDRTDESLEESIDESLEESVNEIIENESLEESIDEDEILDSDVTVPHISRDKIEEIAGFSVKNVDLYRRALVHKSIQKLAKNDPNALSYLKESNERLEFLGDSIIGAIVADYLYKKYPSKNEGYLTKYRTRIVNGKMLSFFAESIGIKDNILMSKQVINMNGTNNQRFLEDAFESFVGAIYYDKGFDTAKSFILNIIDKHLDESEILKDTNYKDLLLRYAQFHKIVLPIYNTIKEQGQPHNRQFVIEVVLFGDRQGKGIASIKKEAEQMAAMEAIKRLNISSDFK